MSWLDDQIESSIDRVTERRLSHKIDSRFEQKLKEGIEDIIVELVQKEFKIKITKGLQLVLGDMDAVFSRFQGLDKQLQSVVKDADKIIRAKMEAVVKKMEFDVTIDPAYEKKMKETLSFCLLQLVQHKVYNRENYLVPILRAKLKEKVEKLNLS